MFFRWLDWGYGFCGGRPQKQSAILVKRTYNQRDLDLLIVTLITWLRCFSGFSTVKWIIISLSHPVVFGRNLLQAAWILQSEDLFLPSLRAMVRRVAKTQTYWATSHACMHRGGDLVAKSRLTLATPWTIAHQARLSMGFPRQEHWSRLPFPSPGDLPDPGIKPGSPALQEDSLWTEPPGKPLRAEYLHELFGILL